MIIEEGFEEILDTITTVGWAGSWSYVVLHQMKTLVEWVTLSKKKKKGVTEEEVEVDDNVKSCEARVLFI